MLYPGQWTRRDRRQTWQRRDVDTICYEAWQILSSPVMSSVLIQWNASYITLYIIAYNVTMLQWPSPVMGHRQVEADVRNFLLLEGAAETAPDAEGIS